MPPFRVSQEDAEKSYVSYMLEAPPFKPFELSEGEKKRIAERYASLLQTQNGEGIDIANLDDKVERLLVGVPKGSRVLLLGVGVGYETKAAKEAGYAATGITLGSRNIDFGRRILHLTPEEHIECSVDVLPFPKETFDAVIGFQIFEHVIAPLLFLLEQSRVLKFGGKLILEWPSAKYHQSGSCAHHEICFTPGQAKALFAKAGFSEIKLYFRNGTEIPEEEYWNAALNQYMYVEGVKIETEMRHVRRAWEL